MKNWPAGKRDPRVREFITPTRVVWSSGNVHAPEHLLTDDEHTCTLAPAKGSETTTGGSILPPDQSVQKPNMGTVYAAWAPGPFSKGSRSRQENRQACPGALAEGSALAARVGQRGAHERALHERLDDERSRLRIGRAPWKS